MKLLKLFNETDLRKRYNFTIIDVLKYSIWLSHICYMRFRVLDNLKLKYGII